MRTLPLILALALTVTACGRIAEGIGEQVAERAIEAETGSTIDLEIDSSGEGLTITGSDGDGEGSFTIGGGEIPAGYPIPFPDGGEVLSVMSADSADGAGGLVVVSYPGDQLDSVKGFYTDFFAGFEDTQVFDIEGQAVEGYTITWTSNEGQTSVILVFAEGSVVVTATAATS